MFSGWDARPSQDTQHKVTRSITTLRWLGGWSSQGTQHNVTRSIQGALLVFSGWDASPSQGADASPLRDTQHKVTPGIRSTRLKLKLTNQGSVRGAN